MDREIPYEGEEVVLVSVAVADPLGDLYLVVEPLQPARGDAVPSPPLFPSTQIKPAYVWQGYKYQLDILPPFGYNQRSGIYNEPVYK